MIDKSVRVLAVSLAVLGIGCLPGFAPSVFGENSDFLRENSQQSHQGTQLPTGRSLVFQEQGVLTNGDFIIPADGSLFDEYVFEGSAGQTVTITVESTDFDTYLAIFTSDGIFVGENDDIDRSNKNSSLTVTLPKNGGYGVLVNGTDPNSRGRYTLRVLE